MMYNSFIDWVLSEVPKGEILEFGSGEGTGRLAEKFKVTSIEHDPFYLEKYKSNYIYAPIVEGWYEREKLKGLKKEFKCIIVDGPTGKIGRWKLLENLDLFDWKTTVVVDDINRAKEYELFQDLIKVLGSKGHGIFRGSDRDFGIIYNG